jgi:hypothetical protein
MEYKIQSLFGGRVALSVRCEGHIETTTNQNYFAYMVVSIRRRRFDCVRRNLRSSLRSARAAYSTTEGAL